MDSSLKLQNNSNIYSDISNNKDIGILLISHGSSLPYAKETFSEISNKFIKLSGLNTEVGYMKVAKPTIPQAINKLKENAKANGNNISRIIALPVFLAKGIHTNIDIPLILGLDPLETDPRQTDGNYPLGHYLHNLEEPDFNGEIQLLSPFGPDILILDFINKKINESLLKSSLPEDAKTGILLVSHGSRLNYNKEFITKVHEMFNKSTDYITSFGFMELVEPNIPQSINNLVSENDIDRLIVIPIFIAPGVHTTRDIPTILGLIEPKNNSHNHSHSHSHNHSHSHSHSHSHVHENEKVDFNGEILYSEPFGADDILIDIIMKNIKNAI